MCTRIARTLAAGFDEMSENYPKRTGVGVRAKIGREKTLLILILSLNGDNKGDEKNAFFFKYYYKCRPPPWTRFLYFIFFIIYSIVSRVYVRIFYIVRSGETIYLFFS